MVPKSASEESFKKILSILKHGNSAEIKRVNGEIQIVEIQRKVKHRMTVATGQPDTANGGQLL